VYLLLCPSALQLSRAIQADAAFVCEATVRSGALEVHAGGASVRSYCPLLYDFKRHLNMSTKFGANL